MTVDVFLAKVPQDVVLAKPVSNCVHSFAVPQDGYSMVLVTITWTPAKKGVLARNQTLDGHHASCSYLDLIGVVENLPRRNSLRIG